MNRRKFIKTGAAGGAALGLTGINLASCAGLSRRQITILHTNDVHSHVDPFPPGHGAFPNMGGAARRAGLIAQIRRENPNTLLLDAGDIFQGTPYFNFYGGELEFRLMSRMDYQAATLGNHDFDNGIPGLLAQLPYASFEFVSANYDFTNTDLNGLVAPYTIRVVDGVRIGIFGLGIELDGLVMPDLYGETLYQDPYERALDMSRTLREEEACHLVICLSHLGFRYDDPSRPSDVLLAQKTEGIDLIIGGHTHTFLEEARVLSNRAGDPVLVNQVGCYGVRLGRVDFFLEPGAPPAGSWVSITV
ncbi:metallophosphatase [Robiginitalea biformata]|uniref:Possible secreted 5'-nucleotidase n=1 Tax=Robiginitalea biformata (strain ATCC BAA-864 / DSM 15991 / KCTC 12146 / HTCC2501) TaxID=313596 RepID=A4CLV7_ROBBH|nr:metallophosphatase [Robiginitalea biformata]EAR15856.1 possible secreted 5'-nucleotidase [Robiginitalea biformata HTCC2501]